MSHLTVWPLAMRKQGAQSAAAAHAHPCRSLYAPLELVSCFRVIALLLHSTSYLIPQPPVQGLLLFTPSRVLDAVQQEGSFAFAWTGPAVFGF